MCSTELIDSTYVYETVKLLHIFYIMCTYHIYCILADVYVRRFCFMTGLLKLYRSLGLKYYVFLCIRYPNKPQKKYG